jgi:phage gpG-like protein
MSPEEFKIELKSMREKLAQAINSDLPIRIGKRSADFFKENFQKEGFVDGGLNRWKEVKRRLDPNTKGAARTRKILTGKTGDLGRSIRYETGNAQVSVFSELIYAAVHNEGLRAGRGKGFIMPKRQFIGDSRELDDIINKEIDNSLNSVFKD